MRRKISKEEKREYILGVKVKLDTKQKFKFVCSAEGESVSTRINKLIEEYIDNYAQKNNIDWSKWTGELGKE